MLQTDLSLYYHYQQASSADAPIIFMLHGYGSHENDLFSLAPALPGDFHIVSLRAPQQLGFGGFAWYEINFDQIGKGKMSNIPQARESLEKTHTFIRNFKKAKGLENNAVWLMGFSQGCILSYALMLNFPQEFTKIIALSGYVLKDIVPEQYKPGDLNHLDLFVAHGTEDPVLPVQWARQTVQMLEKLQLSHVYHEYPIGHGIDPNGLEELKKWINKQLT